MTEKAFALDSFGLRYPGGTSTGPWTFSLDRGCAGALCGPSGSGKTGLLHSLAGLDTGGPRHAVASGHLRAAGPVDLLFERPFLQILGPSVKDELSAAERSSRLAAGARSREREWLLEAFSLDALWDRPVRDLSEGERQKLALACLFLRSPALLLLDQPASSLDLRGKDSLRSAIERFTTRGAAVLIADPDWRAAAPRNTDRLSLFPKASSLPQELSPELLFDGPARPAEGCGESLIEFEGLEIRRGGRTVLRDISGRVCRGEIIALAGDNGSGKTSLLLTIAGLLKPAGGKIHRQDRRLRGARPGLMLQESLWHLSGKPVQGELAWARKGPFGRGGVQPVGLASLLDLKALLERPGLLLSRGEMQRLALAMAVLRNAPLLCLDEPLRFLWEQERKAVARLLQALRNRGVSLLIASPSEELMPWADQVWRLTRGRMEICRKPFACDNSVTLSSSAPSGGPLR